MKQQTVAPPSYGARAPVGDRTPLGHESRAPRHIL
jgi:hypothetical protein